MAFNFGAFAGGLAKGGLQTYQMLSEEEERELIKEERRRALKKDTDIAEAGKSTLGKVGSVDEFGNVITQEQADKDYANKLYAIDPRLGRQARIESFQIKDLERKETTQVKFGQAMERLDKDLATIQSTVESGGMQGIYDLAKRNGLKVDFVKPEKEGSVATIRLLDNDGNVERIFTSASQAGDALSEARMNRFINTEALPLMGDPKSIIDAMNSQRTAAREDKRLGFEQRRLEMEIATNPARVEQIRASIASSNAAARLSNLQADKLRDMQTMNAQMEELLKNPKENATAILQLASRMELRFPDIYTRTGTVKDADGNQTQVTTGILGNVAKGSLKAAGVAILPTQSLPILREAAAAAKGDSKKFLASPAAKQAMTLGATPDDLIKDFMPQAAPTSQPQSAIPVPSTTNSTAAPSATNSAASASSIAPSGRGASVTPNIPPAPPKTIQKRTRGGLVDTGTPNPDYERWERMYGRYQTQQP